MFAYAVKNRIEPFRLGEVTEKGYVGKIIRGVVHERITSDFAKNTIYPTCENAFRTREDDKTPVGLWQGEFWGKWIISACLAAEYTDDNELRDFLGKCAHGLISSADGNGYIGTYKNSLDVFECNPDEGEKIVGWKCKWKWNIWCRKYTLWGLLEVYKLTKDESIFRAAVRFADQLIDELEENGINISDTGTFAGLPSCSIMKPMLLLYEMTENKKYLDFALGIAKDWDDAARPKRKPNLIFNAFSGKPLSEWFDDPAEWAKAYELMSCLDGLLELYRVTGTARYLEAVENIRDLIEKYETNAFFSVGFNDLFISGGNYVNSASEPCDVIHWYRVNYELYCLTGDKKYANTLEIVGYNALLASVTKDAKWGERILRSSGKHQFAPPQPGPNPLPYHHCCVDNLPRGLFNFAESAVMKKNDDIYINFFTEYELDGDIKVSIGDGYLEGAPFEVKTSGAENVFVRMPSYARCAMLDGEKVSTDRGNNGYICVPKEKQSSFMLEFDRNPRILGFAHKMTVPTVDDVHYLRYTLDAGSIGYVRPEYMVKEPCERVMVGPLLMARSIRIGEKIENMLLPTGGFSDCKVTNADFDHNDFQLVCDVCTENGNFEMCDFASAGKMTNEDTYDYIFNIYI